MLGVKTVILTLKTVQPFVFGMVCAEELILWNEYMTSIVLRTNGGTIGVKSSVTLPILN